MAGCSSSAGAAAPVSRGVGGTDADSATGPVAGRGSVAARGLPGEPGPDSGADAGFACGAHPGAAAIRSTRLWRRPPRGTSAGPTPCTTPNGSFRPSTQGVSPVLEDKKTAEE